MNTEYGFLVCINFVVNPFECKNKPVEPLTCPWQFLSLVMRIDIKECNIQQKGKPN